MQGNYEEIQRFLDACDGLLNGKFIEADKKIREILKAIAASEELTNLFSAVTAQLDYPAAKRMYLKFPSSRGAAHGAAFLPAERGELLAFVFCLLVDLDEGSLRLNDFLLRYFYEDGSYTASFTIFTQRLIRPFRDIVAECYPAAGRNAQSARGTSRPDEILGGLVEKIAVERARISRLALPEADGTAAETMLSELTAAAGRKDVAEVKALLTGYRYFLRCVGAEDESTQALFLLAAEL